MKGPRYGTKYARLAALRGLPELVDRIVPLFSIEPPPARVAPAEDRAAAVGRYAAVVAKHYPDLLRDVEDACGPAPWIVRSSGREDLEHDINAGAYESAVCDGPDDLARCVARVMLSGFRATAVQQARLTDPRHKPALIPVFVQRCLPVGVAPTVGNAEAHSSIRQRSPRSSRWSSRCTASSRSPTSTASWGSRPRSASCRRPS